MAKSSRPNSTTKPIVKSSPKGTRKRVAPIHPPKPVNGPRAAIDPPCFCLPDPTGLPDGAQIAVVDGEWMVVYPGTEGQHPELGPGGSIVWVD